MRALRSNLKASSPFAHLNTPVSLHCPPHQKERERREQEKEGKQNIYSCRDKRRKIEANIRNFLCGALR